MTIHLAADHAGFELKEGLKAHLLSFGHDVVDMGAYEFSPEDDYPDFIMPCAQKVAEGGIGIILGGSGQGEAMAANRVTGVRAAVFYGGDLELVRLAREHNDANILSLGARFLSLDEAKAAAELFLSASFSGDERHARRIGKF